MLIKNIYNSHIGKIIILADEKTLKGLWFENQKYFGSEYDISNIEVGENKIILETINWLKRYFLGENPTINTNILLPEATEFRKKVFEVLLSIPYGKTMSYKEVSDKLNEKYGIKSSARAVGGAVGHNPISILIPCHRVVGANGSLTGYAGGIDIKVELLALEGIDIDSLKY